MTLNQIKWTLFIVPALVIGIFETIRHTLLQHILPMEIGNWADAVIDACVIALISRGLLQQFSDAQKELSEEKQAHAILKERERLARVLHDQIAQSIFYTGVQLKTAKTMAGNSGITGLSESLDEVMLSLREIDENIRQSIFNLKEESTATTNLPDRIQSFLSKTLSGTPLTWEFKQVDSLATINPAEQIHLFGILQEAVTNVVKHAHASHIIVTFCGIQGSTTGWVFKIEDNGTGFDTNAKRLSGHGLGIIAGRARDIKADIKIDSGPTGTKISVTRQN